MGRINNMLKGFSEFVYKHFGENSGKMLLRTSILATTLSGIAQSFFILINDKYSQKQKAYMVPQEIMECVVAAVSMVVITQPLQKIAKKLVSAGKLLPKNLVEYMKKNDLLSKRGEFKFNLENDIKNIVNKIEKSDKFISSTTEQKELLLKEHKTALENFEIFQDSTSAYATTAAAALTMGLAVPVIRNYVASYFQKFNMQAYEKHQIRKQSIQNQQFRENMYKNFTRSGLKV